jgi:rubrerythrin
MDMDTLEMLAKNEEEIGELYKLYARVLPQYQDLWLELADDEMNHARWIRDFAKGVDKGTLVLNKKLFPESTFNYYHDYMQGAMEKASKRGIEPMQAFTSALYMEQSLIEKRCFEAVDTGSAEFDKVALRLQQETIGHAKKIEDYWSKVKDKRM